MTQNLIPPTPSEQDYLDNSASDTLSNANHEPMALFEEWLALAVKKEPNDPNAMCLSTVDSAGWPDSRMVLLKGLEAGGFVFYTHLTSQKGRQLESCQKAALLFHWKSLRRQIRIRGTVERVSDIEADAYFATRARQSQIGAWASQQSKPMAEPMELETAVAREAMRFGLGPIPRPENWSGFRLSAKSMEFWSDKPFRLHERLQFDYVVQSQSWTRQRLYP